MLRTHNLTYQYGQSDMLSLPDISIDQGVHSLILGPSGSGKTTLLQLIAGLRTPRTGSVEINGTRISTLRGTSLDEFRGRNIGLVFQTSHFIKSITVKENIRIAQTLAGQQVNDDKIKELLGKLNLASKWEKKTYELSQGEQQRVAIARALINQPKLILADEPTSALDDKNTDHVISLLKQQASEVNATLLVITHDNRLKNNFVNRIEL